MSLKKDDIVEIVEKEDNGWWLVKKNGVEGWAPNNYLELVPPKPKAHHAAPPPPPPPPPPGAGAAKPKAAPVAHATPTTNTATRPPAAKIIPQSVAADASARPVAVFPGIAGNGSATPWKKHTATNSSSESTPTNSRPSSSLAGKPAPPPLASKPKPPPPPVGAKPGVAKPGGKPPVPTAARPPAAPAATRPGSVAKPAAPSGQLDLAAVVSDIYVRASTRSNEHLLRLSLQSVRSVSQMISGNQSRGGIHCITSWIYCMHCLRMNIDKSGLLRSLG